MQGKLIPLCKLYEKLLARRLAREIVIQARTIQEELNQAKTALTPLKMVIEKAYSLSHAAQHFNNTNESVRVPSPALRCSVELGKTLIALSELMLEMPPELLALTETAERRAA